MADSSGELVGYNSDPDEYRHHEPHSINHPSVDITNRGLVNPPLSPSPTSDTSEYMRYLLEASTPADLSSAVTPSARHPPSSFNTPSASDSVALRPNGKPRNIERIPSVEGFIAASKVRQHRRTGSGLKAEDTNVEGEEENGNEDEDLGEQVNQEDDGSVTSSMVNQGPRRRRDADKRPSQSQSQSSRHTGSIRSDSSDFGIAASGDPHRSGTTSSRSLRISTSHSHSQSRSHGNSDLSSPRRPMQQYRGLPAPDPSNASFLRRLQSHAFSAPHPPSPPPPDPEVRSEPDMATAAYVAENCGPRSSSVTDLDYARNVNASLDDMLAHGRLETAKKWGEGMGSGVGGGREGTKSVASVKSHVEVGERGQRQRRPPSSTSVCVIEDQQQCERQHQRLLSSASLNAEHHHQRPPSSSSSVNTESDYHGQRHQRQHQRQPSTSSVDADHQLSHQRAPSSSVDAKHHPRHHYQRQPFSSSSMNTDYDPHHQRQPFSSVDAGHHPRQHHQPQPSSSSMNVNYDPYHQHQPSSSSINTEHHPRRHHHRQPSSSSGHTDNEPHAAVAHGSLPLLTSLDNPFDAANDTPHAANLNNRTLFNLAAGRPPASQAHVDPLDSIRTHQRTAVLHSISRRDHDQLNHLVGTASLPHTHHPAHHTHHRSASDPTAPHIRSASVASLGRRGFHHPDPDDNGSSDPDPAFQADVLFAATLGAGADASRSTSRQTNPRHHHSVRSSTPIEGSRAGVSPGPSMSAGLGQMDIGQERARMRPEAEGTATDNNTLIASFEIEMVSEEEVGGRGGLGREEDMRRSDDAVGSRRGLTDQIDDDREAALFGARESHRRSAAGSRQSLHDDRLVGSDTQPDAMRPPSTTSLHPHPPAISLASPPRRVNSHPVQQDNLGLLLSTYAPAAGMNAFGEGGGGKVVMGETERERVESLKSEERRRERERESQQKRSMREAWDAFVEEEVVEEAEKSGRGFAGTGTQGWQGKHYWDLVGSEPRQAKDAEDYERKRDSGRTGVEERVDGERLVRGFDDMEASGYGGVDPERTREEDGRESQDRRDGMQTLREEGRRDDQQSERYRVRREERDGLQSRRDEGTGDDQCPREERDGLQPRRDEVRRDDQRHREEENGAKQQREEEVRQEAHPIRREEQGGLQPRGTETRRDNQHRREDGDDDNTRKLRNDIRWETDLLRREQGGGTNQRKEDGTHDHHLHRREEEEEGRRRMEQIQREEEERRRRDWIRREQEEEEQGNRVGNLRRAMEAHYEGVMRTMEEKHREERAGLQERVESLEALLEVATTARDNMQQQNDMLKLRLKAEGGSGLKGSAELHARSPTYELIQHDKLEHKYQLWKVDEMEADELAGIVKQVLTKLELDDPSLIPSVLANITKVVSLLPQMQRFIERVDKVVWSPGTTSAPDDDERDIAAAALTDPWSFAFRPPRMLGDTIARLERWRNIVQAVAPVADARGAKINVAAAGDTGGGRHSRQQRQQQQYGRAYQPSPSLDDGGGSLRGVSGGRADDVARRREALGVSREEAMTAARDTALCGVGGGGSGAAETVWRHLAAVEREREDLEERGRAKWGGETGRAGGRRVGMGCNL
ncbi:hypothetical protein BC938DRAFT_471584 [Jimgerdemannia flammicorona]|uniref:Centrosomal protein of 70 kDa n=1 Tax=Jimgerdemannia flammicorona TaxID=994334 RepID=A0A433Q7T7_9FUNG|nr:hypothetical protein BC938DRAFT_471584 [Jimgerdemannia flammicorona]